MRRELLTSSGFLVLALQFAASAVHAQILVDPTTGTAISAENRLQNLAINSAIGSVTGLVWAAIRHSPKTKGAAQGALGGALMSVGRQIAATAFNGSGFVGRQVSATGVSLTATAGESKTTFSFPFGPLSIECSEGSYDWRLNLSDFVATAGFAISANTRLDLGKTFSSGTPVFRDRRSNFGRSGNVVFTGASQLGTIRLSRGAFDPFTGESNVIYHENVHILQDDYFEETIGLPVEREVIRHLPLGRRFLRHFDLGLTGPMLEGAMSGIRYQSRPWEREAYSLTANLRY